MTAGLGDWVHDVSPADWIAARLHPFFTDAGSVVPEGFEAYARVFHPLDGDGRWTDLARRNGRIAHPEMQLHAISTPRGERIPDRAGPMDPRVSWGSLPLEERRALVGVLGAHTTTPDRCWFAVWEGFGDLDRGDVTARVELPARSYLLASGAVDAALAAVPTIHGAPTGGHSPNLWWPEDRAWFVATEIDYAWTYVGGTRAAIGAVLADARLEALPARLADRPFADADVTNAALDG